MKRRQQRQSMIRVFSSLMAMMLAALLPWMAGAAKAADSRSVIKPKVVTEKAKHDTDDPAIWIHPDDPAQSLIIGTDKNRDGALYVYNLDGKIIREVRDIRRPNNVDVEYGLMLNDKPVDIVVTTERYEDRLRIFSLPDFTPIDNGGIPVFEGEKDRDPMGISLYRRPSDGTIFAIVGRKKGPKDGRYLWQYRLEDDGTGHVAAVKVREFGIWSGRAEIEAIAVDDELGYVYYSDETKGVRKYHADPDQPGADKELALFATDHVKKDHEGLSIYRLNDGTGYILLSNQQADEFNVYPREGTAGNPHNHPLLKAWKASTHESDGSEVTGVVLGDAFPNGLFVAMSDNVTFQLYDWADIAGDDLKVAPDMAVGRP